MVLRAFLSLIFKYTLRFSESMYRASVESALTSQLLGAPQSASFQLAFRWRSDTELALTVQAPAADREARVQYTVNANNPRTGSGQYD